MPLSAGVRLGSYEVISPIGSGGMGEVYRARDARLGRDVALKVLPSAMAADPDRLRRFTLEARAVGALNHPNVLTVYEVGDQNGQPFLATELLDGETIREKLNAGPLPVSKATDWARQVAVGLAAAHARGIAHRDIKPDNLFVTTDGRVKILDFGLATQTRPDSHADDDTRLLTGTVAGVVLGTVGYMSPEQVRGLPVDHRTDIFSLGIVLFEMLSGKRPFAGDSAVETMNAILTEDAPDLTAPGRSVPPALADVARHCLEKQPDERFQSARDLAYALHAAAGATTGSAPTAAEGRRRTVGLRVALLALTGAFVGATAMWLAMRTAGPPDPDDASSVVGLTLATPSHAELALERVPDLAMTPDGRRIVYPGRRADPEGVRLGATHLVVRDLHTFEVTPLEDLGIHANAPFISPDGMWVGFETRVGARFATILAKAPLSGGPMVQLCDLTAYGPLLGASWTGDGITFGTELPEKGLLHIPATGGTPTEITAPKRADGERDHLWPMVLPDGRGTLFSILREDGSLDVAVLPAGEPSWRVIVKGGASARYLPSGHLTYVRDGTLYGVGFEVSSLSVTTEPVVLVQGIRVKPVGAADVVVASNGTLVYLAGESRQPRHRVIWIDRDGSVSALPLEPRNYRDATLSPDGRRIAISLAERGTTSLWVYDIGRDAFTRVSPRDLSATDPVWSPDGTRLAFWSDTQKAILTMGADGSGAPTPLTRAEAGNLYPNAWSPDGRVIAFIRETPRLSLHSVSTSPPHEVRPIAVGEGAQVEASYSRDGKWIVHLAFDGSQPEVVVGPAASADRRWPVAPTGRRPMWSADGREVFFLGENTIQSIAIDPATGLPIGRVRKVIDLPPALAGGRPFRPSLDGRRFLMLERVNDEAPAAEIRVVLNWLDDVRVRMANARRLAAK